MTLIQDDSDRIEPADGRADAGDRPFRPVPPVEIDAAAPLSGRRDGAPRIGLLPLAVVASIALHLALAAFLLAGPAGDAGSVLLSGIRGGGPASIGDAKAENAGSGRAAPEQDRAISVVLAPPVAAKPTVPHAARSATPAPAEARGNDRTRPETPSVLSARAAAPKAVAPETRDAKAIPTPRPPATPAEPRQLPARPAKPEDGLTFRRPFLLPAGGGARSWRGALTGSARGGDASSSSGAADKGSGDAAVSNYPGRVARKLNGALRYPPGAKAGRLRGEATVSFAVDGSGRASAVRVVASSGFEVLDRAAIAAVRRASPFPPIPAAARRGEWPFTVTLAFGK